VAANTSPIYTRVADIQWVESITVANNTIDLTSGTSYLIWTADATEGGYLREIRIKANPANNTAATVARIWINNGSTLGTSSNSALLTEVGIPATTAIATQPLPDIVVPINMAVPATYRFYLTVGTAPGGSGEFTATGIGGKY
jgi:hypothetical protein